MLYLQGLVLVLLLPYSTPPVPSAATTAPLALVSPFRRPEVLLLDSPVSACLASNLRLPALQLTERRVPTACFTVGTAGTPCQRHPRTSTPLSLALFKSFAAEQGMLARCAIRFPAIGRGSSLTGFCSLPRPQALQLGPLSRRFLRGLRLPPLHPKWQCVPTAWVGASTPGSALQRNTRRRQPLSRSPLQSAIPAVFGKGQGQLGLTHGTVICRP